MLFGVQRTIQHQGHLHMNFYNKAVRLHDQHPMLTAQSDSLVKSEITAQGGLLVNAVTAAYQDGAYPPSPNTAGKVATAGSLGFGNPKSAGGGGKQSVSSVVSGTVLDVAGTEVQVAFRDGTAGGVRWIPYLMFLEKMVQCQY